MRKIGLTLCLGMFLIVSMTSFVHNPPSSFAQSSATFGDWNLKVGASGDDVYELQGRLKLLGFYTGDIDGKFGWRTYWALRNFQYEFGLTVDGVAGPKSKLKLWQATKHWKPKVNELPPSKRPTQADQPGKQSATNKDKTVVQNNGGYSQNDIRLMANAVHGEARGEPYIGKVAVAAVILNRVESASFPNTISGVIFEPGAFTAVADGQIWLTPNAEAKKAVNDAINGWDPSGNALYYYNPAKTTNNWIYSRPVIKRIGKHTFAK